MLDFLNAIVINLSIIVGSTIALYFISIKQSLKNSTIDTDFIPNSGRLSLPIWSEILLGIMIGLLSFFISLNSIPIESIRSIDVRYLPIYFSVYYGSSLIGITTSIVLISAKSIQYAYTGALISEYLNNIFLTTLLLLVSIVLSKKKLKPKSSTILFLLSVLTIRSILFSIIFYPVWEIHKLINIGMHFVIFSSIFLLTSWFINAAISLSQSIHIYRTSSIYDGLTHLYNKESFYFFLDHAYNDAILKQDPFSLAIIDVDNFKEINDSFGHPVGDQALIEIAKVLTEGSTISRNPRICRIGGDEFAIVFKHTAPDANLFMIDKVTKLHETPIHIDEHLISVSISVGLVTFEPTEHLDTPYKSVEELYQCADDVLYEAKNNGKDTLTAIIQTI